MGYKTEFQANNADLQAILDLVNSLPDQATTVCGIATPSSSTTMSMADCVGKKNLVIACIVNKQGSTVSLTKITVVNVVIIDGDTTNAIVAYHTSAMIKNDPSMITWDSSSGTLTSSSGWNLGDGNMVTTYRYVAW